MVDDTSASPRRDATVLVRPVRLGEHDALGELTVAVYREVLASDLGSYAEILRDVAGRVAAGCQVLVAVAGDQLLGGVTYVPAPGGYAQLARLDEAELRMLVVDPAMAGHGAGTALVGACIDRAVAGGRRALTLGTMPEMEVAQRLYRRLGFARRPERDGTVPGGRPLLCYSLDLASAGVDSSVRGPSAGGSSDRPDADADG